MSIRSQNRFSGGNFRYLRFCVVILVVFISSCGNRDNIPDVSKINVSLKTYRFDKDLYAIDTNHIADGLKKLQVKYPDFLNYYLDTLREFNIHGNFNDTVTGIKEYLKLVLTFKDYVNLQDTIKKYYPDNKEIDKELTNGFRFLKYYFPDATVPRIMYLNLGLSMWSAFPVDKNTFCVCLDKFLGDQFPFYKSIQVPDYMLPHFRTSAVPVEVFRAYYMSDHPFETDDRTLLDLIIQRGKEQYFLHKVLPRTPDSVLFGFKQMQLDWCGKNEAYLYNFFIHQNLLYSKDGHNIMPYVNEGPFAKGLESPDAPVKYTPGNIGMWLGYRIVCAYMEQNPKTTLPELVKQKTDPAKFLDAAKYRPK
jgi:hypothetical protein